jgi:pyroglutamyl-peptidase
MTEAGSQSVRVLVTGFGPFPGIDENASEAMVRRLEGSAAAPGLEVATAVIPVAWSEARGAMRSAIAGFEPHAVLHFGVSKRAFGFEIETRAFNMSGPREDQDGAVRGPEALVFAGPPILKGTLPPLALVQALRSRGFPALLSTDAGRYLCNALYYWSLADSETGGRLVSFVHMPAIGAETEIKSPLTVDAAVTAARILVRASAEAVLRAKQSEATREECNGHASQTFHRSGRSGGGAFWRSGF